MAIETATLTKDIGTPLKHLRMKFSRMHTLFNQLSHKVVDFTRPSK
jgi:hypothetical protein